MNEKAYAIEVTYPDGHTNRITNGSAGHEYRGTIGDAGYRDVECDRIIDRDRLQTALLEVSRERAE